MPKRDAVCIACYVTLPKIYRAVEIDFANPNDFSKRHFNSIVYSFLVVPVCCEVEARLISKLIERCRVLEIG